MKKSNVEKANNLIRHARRAGEVSQFNISLRYETSILLKDIASKIKPSKRGELEITEVLKFYLLQDKLNVELMGRGFAWLDTGTHESLVDATLYIKTIEDRQGLKIGCIEEVAYRMGYIDKKKILELAEPLKKNNYGQYLINLVK